MKKSVFNIFMVAVLAISITGCKKAKEANTSEAEIAIVAENTSEKFIANIEQSTIEWKGFKPTGSHTGTINIESGYFTTNDGKIQSGSFLMDMKSIKVTDIPVEKKGNASLVGHLSSADFFDVEAFPKAAFEITGLDEKDGKTMLSGNLTMKGVKNNITFPVTVSENGNDLSLMSDAFIIDRTKWNIEYKSKSIFGNLGDKFINDDIELKITVKATKS